MKASTLAVNSSKDIWEGIARSGEFRGNRLSRLIINAQLKSDDDVRELIAYLYSHLDCFTMGNNKPRTPNES